MDSRRSSVLLLVFDTDMFRSAGTDSEPRRDELVLRVLARDLACTCWWWCSSSSGTSGRAASNAVVLALFSGQARGQLGFSAGEGR